MEASLLFNMIPGVLDTLAPLASSTSACVDKNSGVGLTFSTHSRFARQHAVHIAEYHVSEHHVVWHLRGQCQAGQSVRQTADALNGQAALRKDDVTPTAHESHLWTR